MIDPQVIDDIAKKLNDAIPSSLQQMQEDVQRNIRSVLQSAFAKLELMTREEFDAQARVLQRTRKKLERLEKDLDTIEEKLSVKKKKK